MKKGGVKLAASILICLTAGLIGAVFTIDSVQTWYKTIEKPSYSPPNWVFGPVWTILYVLMGVSAYLIWVKGLEKKEARMALMFFVTQLALNALWSILFFGMRNPFYGLIEIVFLWAAIAITIQKFYKISRTAAYLQIPYICWVSYAAFLNYGIWRMNM